MKAVLDIRGQALQQLPRRSINTVETDFLMFTYAWLGICHAIPAHREEGRCFRSISDEHGVNLIIKQ